MTTIEINRPNLLTTTGSLGAEAGNRAARHGAERAFVEGTVTATDAGEDRPCTR